MVSNIIKGVKVKGENERKILMREDLVDGVLMGRNGERVSRPRFLSPRFSDLRFLIN